MQSLDEAVQSLSLSMESLGEAVQALFLAVQLQQRAFAVFLRCIPVFTDLIEDWVVFLDVKINRRENEKNMEDEKKQKDLEKALSLIHNENELLRLPYISHKPKDDRQIVTLSYRKDESKDLTMVVLLDDSNFIETDSNQGSLSSGSYYSADCINKSTDLKIEIIDLIVRHLSFPDLLKSVFDIENDLINALASIHKYFILLEYSIRHKKDYTIPSLVINELEFAFGNHRSFYDLVNRIIRDVNQRYNGVEIKDSFRKNAQQADSVLHDKYKLPSAIIKFYKAKENVFMALRKIRDDIYHHGKSIDYILRMEDGFGIRVSSYKPKLLASLDFWAEGKLKQNGVGSILPIFALLAKDMFSTTTFLAGALINCFKDLPEDITTGYNVFSRNPIYPHFFRLQEYAEQQWFDPSIVLNEFRISEIALKNGGRDEPENGSRDKA